MVSFVRAAQEVLLVVCDEPTSITDAYALIKLLNRDHGMTRFRVLANMAHSPQEGRNLFAKLTKVTDRFLDVALQYVGVIPYDESVRKAVQKQRAVYEAFPARRRPWPSRRSRRRSTAGRCRPTRAGTWSSSSNDWSNTPRQVRPYDSGLWSAYV